MAENKGKIPPAAGGGARLYYLTGKTYEAIRRLVGMAPLVPDSAQFGVSERGGVRTFRLRSQAVQEALDSLGGGAGEAAAFYKLYTDGDGDTYLQGGSITGGRGGSESIADKKVIDAVTGITGTAGHIYYVAATCEAEVADGIMLPGAKLISAVDGSAASLPANHTFTVAAKEGAIHVEIGRWTADEFLPAAAGNLYANGCIGEFVITRV